MKIIISLSIFSIIFSQETLPFDLPSTRFSIDEKSNVIRVNSKLSGYTSILKLISSPENNIWENDEYTVFQLHVELTATEKIRCILSIAEFPLGGQLFISDGQGNFQGPWLFDQIRNETTLVSGLLHTEKITVEYLHPKDQPLPGIYVTHIVLDEIYTFDNKSAQPMIERGIKKTRENPVVLVTGYWPPTNEMIRHFSQNPELNPDGWQGEDWDGSGYDIVSFFPEFDPPDCWDCGMGYGDLVVDYQDTSEDYWPIADGTKPLGIITFSRGFNDFSWELEMNTYNRTNWYADYQTPYYPIPNPPDQDQPVGYNRQSALPVNDIRQAIEDLNIGINPYIDYAGHSGAFLSEFIGFHGIWYKDLHQYDDNYPCFSAGHIHVGAQISTETAKLATEESIRVLIEYLSQFIYIPGDVNGDEQIDILDIVLMVNNIMGLVELTPVQFLAADLNENGIINVLDIIQLVNIILDT